MSTEKAKASPDPTNIQAYFDKPLNSLFRSQTQDRVPVKLVYNNEGGANVIYCLKSSDGPLPEMLQGQVLRIRKTIDFTTAEETESYFRTTIAPLILKRHLAGPTLLPIETGLIKYLNRNLHDMETSEQRPKARRNLYLSEDESFGLLIPDMSPEKGKSITIEFKPKWLAQSPSAPKDSKRCRTCALEAMRAQDRLAKTSTRVSHGKTHHCPLKLLDGTPEDLQTIMHDIVVAHTEHERYLTTEQVEEISGRLAFFFGERGDYRKLLFQLRRNQIELDQHGIPQAGQEVPKDYMIAMTLRDCSLFIQIPLEPGKHLNARFSDLDPKTSTAERFARWRETEERLIKEGWYGGKPIEGEEKTNECLLGRQKPH